MCNTETLNFRPATDGYETHQLTTSTSGNRAEAAPFHCPVLQPLSARGGDLKKDGTSAKFMAIYGCLFMYLLLRK